MKHCACVSREAKGKEARGADAAVCRFLTTVGEGGFRGQKSPDRLPEFRAEFEELLGGLEASLGKHGGPFLLGCGSCAVAPAARQGLEIVASTKHMPTCYNMPSGAAAHVRGFYKCPYI